MEIYSKAGVGGIPVNELLELNHYNLLKWFPLKFSTVVRCFKPYDRLGRREHWINAHFDLSSLRFSCKDKQTKYEATVINNIKTKKEYFRSRSDKPRKGTDELRNLTNVEECFQVKGRRGATHLGTEVCLLRSLGLVAHAWALGAL